ncbi:hypothetical protein AB0L13_28860 [Saccharopolyspora shandongensis]|uniref:hypothetical protein n=1 Tax=Saccharopolyspora shandongensis TaxID=418495 RepID=UPI0034455E57
MADGEQYFDSCDTDTLIEVLSELRAFLAPQPVTLIWGGLPAHRSKAMTGLGDLALIPAINHGTSPYRIKLE